MLTTTPCVLNLSNHKNIEWSSQVISVPAQQLYLMTKAKHSRGTSRLRKNLQRLKSPVSWRSSCISTRAFSSMSGLSLFSNTSGSASCCSHQHNHHRHHTIISTTIIIIFSPAFSSLFGLSLFSNTSGIASCCNCHHHHYHDPQHHHPHQHQHQKHT